MPKPGNIISQSVSGSTGGVYSPVPITNNAAALVFYLPQQVGKILKSVSLSLARNPFLASGAIGIGTAGSLSVGFMRDEVFGRLTVFRNFSQDPTNLFDPYFDSQYTNALVPPNSSDYYGARINYAKDDIILDVIINKIECRIFDLHCESIQPNEKPCVVLTPFYYQISTGVTPRIFGEYIGDGLVRTLSLQGQTGYGG